MQFLREFIAKPTTIGAVAPSSEYLARMLLEGLDLHEHGMVAYPEYVIHGYEPTPHSQGAAPGMASA